jgi:hypothetical protein
MKRSIVWPLLRRSRALRRVRRHLKQRFVDRPRLIPHKLGVSGFIASLNEQQCRYVILRWFDRLPVVDDGGDLDVLLEDSASVAAARMLTRSSWRGDVPCDLYSVHGLPSFAHKRYAYYPPHVAVGILDRAQRHSSGALVPCPEDHFFSLAFHALYHKGYGSGLPVSIDMGPKGRSNRHDYRAVLQALAADAGYEGPITMVDLDRELDRRGWRPPADTLMKWGVENGWCREVAERLFSGVDAPPGLMVFLVRNIIDEPDHITEIERIMDQWGFRRLMTKRLEPDERERAAHQIRGGNWGRGPWPVSGGPPAWMIAAIDPVPTPPSAKLVQRHPGVDNGRIFAFKQTIRDWWNDGQRPGDRTNIMHTSDNAAHSAHYLQVINPAVYRSLVLDGQSLSLEHADPHEPLKTLACD